MVHIEIARSLPEPEDETSMKEAQRIAKQGRGVYPAFCHIDAMYPALSPSFFSNQKV
jgi:hypothetical protein